MQKGCEIVSYIWSLMIIVSVIFGIRNGNLEQVVTAGLNGAEASVSAALSLAGVMCLWTGLLNTARECGLAGMIQRLLSPVLRRLFPGIKKGDPAETYISMNVTANLLGMGNGATPMGIKAMEAMADGTGRATGDMCMFAVLNTAAFQLIPTTILALRAAAGSTNPSSVVAPIWIVSLLSLAVGILAVKGMNRLAGRRRI